MPWREQIGRLLHRTAHEVENVVDEAWTGLGQRLGWNKPRSVLCFHGWAHGRQARCGCRVLANEPHGGPLEDDRWWDNLLNTYRHWNSREVPGVTVEATLAGVTVRQTTDEEGYAWFRFELPKPLGPDYWHEATVRVVDELADEPVADRIGVIHPPAGARFGLISDMDDTVIHTGVTNLLTAAKLTFLGNALTRKPLHGVDALYRALCTGTPEGGGTMRQPAFYVSSSAWNLYHMLSDFLKLNALPPGPLLLQDLGIDAEKFIKTKGHEHKLDKARAILDNFKDLPFVLFGDSGQHDADLYVRLAEQRPGRVVAIYIRDVDPGHATDRDAWVNEHIARATELGVPMMLIKDSAVAARDLAGRGLLDPATLPAIEAATRRDEHRPPESIVEQVTQAAVEHT